MDSFICMCIGRHISSTVLVRKIRVARLHVRQHLRRGPRLPIIPPFLSEGGSPPPSLSDFRGPQTSKLTPSEIIQMINQSIQKESKDVPWPGHSIMLVFIDIYIYI